MVIFSAGAERALERVETGHAIARKYRLFPKKEQLWENNLTKNVVCKFLTPEYNLFACAVRTFDMASEAVPITFPTEPSTQAICTCSPH